MPWDPLPSTFDKARRREAYRRFGRAVAGRPPSPLLVFEEVKERLRFFEQTYVGIRAIPVAAIVGSSGRSRDFDKNFLPLRPDLRERWTAIERAFPEGGFPPIVVYQVAGSYFVVDGHHRVAIAKLRKQEFIDAEITELRTRYELPEGADIGEIIFREQQHLLMHEGGLDRSRPDAVIEFSQAHRYVELLELIRLHGFHIMTERAELLSIEEISGDWYDHVFLPAIEQIREEGLAGLFPGETDADLFLRIWQRRRTLFPERGALSLEDTVRTVGAETGPRRRSRGK
ncbi:DUF4032 domain-containing protein [soil metagenome]|nr:ParB N-terminal domain-containing protein [Actinomycetota bacterium]